VTENPDQTMQWLTEPRLKLYSRLLVAVYLVVWGVWVGTGSGLTDRGGAPVGVDFSHYWTASLLALNGEPAAVYDFPRLRALEQATFGTDVCLRWLYPPTFLLLVLPLALLPYLAALAVWLLPPLVCCLWVVHRIAPRGVTVWLALAFPGAYLNLIYGQNGFLTTALLGAGLLLLESRPVAAGALLGLLSFKPHLAALVPVALLAGRRWRALAASAAAAAALIGASVLVLGVEVWTAFLAQLPVHGQVLAHGKLSLETGSMPLWFHKMPSVLFAAFLAGVGSPTAYALQGAVMLLAGAALVWVWRRDEGLPLRAATLVVAILLFAPYAAVYDLCLLAVPLAFLGWEGYTRGWRPGEEPALVLAFFTPLLSPVIGEVVRIQITPLILLALLLIILRRGGWYPGTGTLSHPSIT
jgi:hypothetical protein